MRRRKCWWWCYGRKLEGTKLKNKKQKTKKKRTFECLENRPSITAKNLLPKRQYPTGRRKKRSQKDKTREELRKINNERNKY
jgi:hypothetical protein